jgi:hypothetical protein
VIVRCFCGKTFEAKRSNAKYCCNAHRVEAQRAGLVGAGDAVIEAWRESDEAHRIVLAKIAALDSQREQQHAEIAIDTALEHDPEAKQIAYDAVDEAYWRSKLSVEAGAPPPHFKLPPDW